MLWGPSTTWENSQRLGEGGSGGSVSELGGRKEDKREKCGGEGIGREELNPPIWVLVVWENGRV